jgi:hypothetical protein
MHGYLNSRRINMFDKILEYEGKITLLEKENEYLTHELECYFDTVDHYRDQIEQMKCCCNCTYGNDYHEIDPCDDCEDMKTKWKLKR